MIKLRTGTTDEWAASDPVLEVGEVGWDSDLEVMRIGNGLDVWSDLDDFGGGGGGGSGITTVNGDSGPTVVLDAADVGADPAGTAATAAAAALSDAEDYADAKVAALVGTAPAILDTLGEIADALNDDDDAFNTLLTAIAAKLDIADFEPKRVVTFVANTPDGPPLSIGDAKSGWRVPSCFNGWNIVGAEGMVTRASDSGVVTMNARRRRSGTYNDIFSTALTIDATELDSGSAAVAVSINGSYDDLATGDQIVLDIDTAGTGVLGATLQLIIEKP